MPPSKQATNRIRSSAVVVAAAETHAARIAGILSPMLAPQLAPDEVLPDLALVSRLVGRLLASSTTALRTADENHQAELSDDQGPRDRRDAAAAALTDEVVRVREIATAAYGDGVLAKLGVKGNTPQQDPLAIARFATTLAIALRSPELPPSRLAGYDLDRAGEAAMLIERAAEIERWLGVVATEAREAQETQIDRTQALEGFDQEFSRCAGFLSALLRLAREDEHAERVRPGRSGGRLANEDTVSVDGAAPENPFVTDEPSESEDE